MKKYQYIVAAACVLVSAIGFGSIYAINQNQQKQEEIQKIEIGSILEEESKEKEEETELENQMAELESDFSTEQMADFGEDSDLTTEEQVASRETEDNIEKEAEENEVTENVEDAAVSNITEEALHFQPEKGLVWPVKGSVLLDYSMDSTIYFPTLQQYKYNPAMVLSGKVNDKVYFIAKGKVTNIETNEVTGCTVTQDIGDGYTAIYGQLKELNFKVGDMVQSGQVVGYINEPTKYYSLEGSNVYFQLLKNGIPVDPEDVLP